MSEQEFKVGDRVEWCLDGRFDLYEDSSDTRVHDFGEVMRVTGDGLVWYRWNYYGVRASYYPENIRKAPLKEPTSKNLKLELRVKGLELTVKVLEQDEVDTCKDDECPIEFVASDCFKIMSETEVEIVPHGELFIKGVESGDSYSYEFKSEDKLNSYVARLKQAVKEFNAAGGFAKKVEETVEIIE